MPYQQNSDLPESARNVLPEAAQTIFRSAFNSAMERGMSEEEAMKTAWAACKEAGYAKGEDGQWSMVDGQRSMDGGQSQMMSMVAKVRAHGDKGESDVSVLFDTG